jgi:hypothetical protein
MLMLRIDEATIELRQGNITHSYKIGVDRSLTESAPGDYSIIRNFVASNIK